MSPYKFKTMQASRNWKEYIFFTENQGQDIQDKTYPAAVSLTFCELIVSPWPAILFFKGPGGWLRLSCVSSIACDSESSVLGDLLEVTCRCGEGVTTYTIIAR